MNKYLLLLTVGIVVLFPGCATERQSSREAFLSRQGKERVNYKFFYSVSPESLQRSEDDFLYRVNLIVLGIKKAGLECTNDYVILDKSLDRAQLGARLYFDEEVKAIESLNKSYDRKTDSVFYYEYQSTNLREIGWLIVKTDGMAKKKIILGRDDHK